MKTKRRTYPGSIYADRGKLYVHIFGKRHATGLEDNKSGRLQAEKVLIALYENHWGVARSPIRPPTVSEAFVAFLHHKMNRMPKTKTQYELAKKAILKTDVMDVDEIERDIQNYVRCTKHSNVSINNYLTHLQIFLNFCTEKNWLPNTKFKKNYKVFVAEPKVITWTDSEIEYLIKKLEKSHRNVALMIKFQLQTGARLIDCLTLEPDDIKENSVLFKNKITKKTEERPLSPEAISVLSQLPKYIDRIFPWKPGSTTRLHKWLDEACYERIDGGLREVIKRNGRSFQEFRSTFRMKLLKVGTPQEYVRWLMRHKSLLITDKFYTEYEEKEIQNYLEKIA